MRDVNQGWVSALSARQRASFVFIGTYIHIFRGLYYGSYRRRVRCVDARLVIFLLMMATAFWAMSFPGARMSSGRPR